MTVPRVGYAYAMTDGANSLHEPKSRRAEVLLVVLLLAAIAVGVGMVLTGFVHVDNRDTLYVEVAKSGLQLVVVGVLGSAFAAGWRWIDFKREVQRRDYEYERDQRRARREMQLALFVRLVNSYNEVKAIRRTLRSYGFRNAVGALDEPQVHAFREQMARLNGVQLEFEALKREVGEARLFDGNSAKILDALYKIESHLNKVLRVWEYHGIDVEVGADAKIVVDGLQDLIGKSAIFKSGVVEPRRKATQLMQDSLFGSSSQSVSSKLDDLEGKIDSTDT